MQETRHKKHKKEPSLLPETTRRKFIERCGRRAIWVPPTMAIILTASASPAHARSSYQSETVDYEHRSNGSPGQNDFEHHGNPFTQFFRFLSKLFGR
jgi:hypothetical protein